METGMISIRRVQRTAWLSCGLACGLGAAGLTLWAHNRSYLPMSAVVSTVTFQALGVLITARQPRNRIGWIFCAIGVLNGLWLLTSQYAIYALITERGSLPAAAVAAWLSSWIWAPPIWLTGTLCVLLFPDGQLPSRAWRPIPWLAGSGLVLFIGAVSLAPWEGRSDIASPPEVEATATGLLAVVRPLLSLAVAVTPSKLQGGVTYPIGNPLGLGGAAAALATTAAVGAVLILASFLASVTAPVLRFRHARGAERQQLKWVAYAVGLITLIYLLANTRLPGLAELALAVNVSLFPVAVAIAILRYHMFDIDLVINRTLVYGLLTGTLGLVYAGVVLVLGQVFGGVKGNPPSWHVAGATLAAVALLHPARRRIQAAVDRRFNRRRYDAAKTIEAFSARLHQQIDLETLTAELLAVAKQTMEPTTASLWLRPLNSGRAADPGRVPSIWGFAGQQAALAAKLRQSSTPSRTVTPTPGRRR
jgi:hypothetical protein